MLQNIIKWGVVLSLVGGLSACMMDDRAGRNDSMQNPMTYDQGAAKQATATKTAVSKAGGSSSSSEPVQKTMPGPKRAAAPQLPVIQ